MSALKRAEKTERRVFSEEDERELLNIGATPYTYDGVIDYSYADDSEDDSIAENYRKLINFAAESASDDALQEEALAEESFVEEQEGISAPVFTGLEDDLMPTSTTMQFTDEDADNVYFAQRTGTSEKVSHLFRTKAVLVAYAIVIVTLISLIAINASVLLRAKHSVNALSGEVAILQQQSNQLAGEIGELTDYDTVIQNGMQNGMTANTNTQAMEILTPVNNPTVSLQGNWFDTVCNFFENLFH